MLKIDTIYKKGILFVRLYGAINKNNNSFDLYIYDENYSGYNPNEKELIYKHELIEGENTVIIDAVSTEGTSATYRGKCSYNP